MNNTAPKHLNPFIFVEDFKLETGLRERKIGVYPPHFNLLAKQILNYFLNVHFQIMHDIFHRNLRLIPQHVNSLHLMKHRVMELINFITTINVT